MQQNIFAVTKEFFENKIACKQALCQLRQGTEIAIILEGRTPCALFQEGGQVKFEKRAAHTPDIAFSVFPEAVRRLSLLEGENMTELGIEILREMAAGTISIEILGSTSNILHKGYLKIIIEAGPDFLSYIKNFGIDNLGKLSQLLKKTTGAK